MDGWTLFLAVWGAALSTFVVLRDSLRARPKGRVQVDYEFLPNVKPSAMGIAAKFSNVGREPIFLARAVMRSSLGPTGWRERSSLSETILPELAPWHSCTAHFTIGDDEEINRIAETVYGTPVGQRFSVDFYDQVRRRYSSGPMALATIEQTPGKPSFSVTVPPDRRLLARGRTFLRKLRRSSHIAAVDRELAK